MKRLVLTILAVIFIILAFARYKIIKNNDEQGKPFLLIIPDVHGRSFWKKAVESYPDIPVIFLGDYLDPYNNEIENISNEEAFANFREILEYKRKRSSFVTLLLGNHDIHYIDNDYAFSRKDTLNEKEIHDIFMESLSLFKLVANVEISDRQILFSHAGVLVGWVRKHYPSLLETDVLSLCDSINNNLKDEKLFVKYISDALMDVTSVRGGDAEYGSLVWADDTEHIHSKEHLPGIYQIFGHSQLENAPKICEHHANLDCRRAFLLTDKANIIECRVNK